MTAPSPSIVPYMYASVRATRTAPTWSPLSRCAAYARSQPSIAGEKSSSRYATRAKPSITSPDGDSPSAPLEGSARADGVAGPQRGPALGEELFERDGHASIVS